MTSDLTLLRTRLAEAEETLHQLLMGRSVQALSHTLGGTNSVQYTPANIPELRTHVAQLKAEIAVRTGRGRRRAFRIT